VTEEVRQVALAADDDSDCDEAWERVVSALESVEGVISVAEHDNESWDVYGTPSGEALTAQPRTL
jgi:hypothetical protein